MEEKLAHLWIPNEKVTTIEKKPTGRNKDLGRSPEIHGSKLSSDLTLIKDISDKKRVNNSLSDEELIVFKVIINDQDKIDNRARQKDIEDNGMQINAVRDPRNAIVSTSSTSFKTIQSKVNQYTNEGKYCNFQYFDNFEPYVAAEKQTTHLRSEIKEMRKKSKKDQITDIQLLLLPKLSKIIYERVLDKLLKKISDYGNNIYIEKYYLSDGTPVIRAKMPLEKIDEISDDDAIYRVQETVIYSSTDKNQKIDSNPQIVEIDPKIDLDNLPIVGILDNGVQFPKEWRQLVVDRWIADDVDHFNCDHGTGVASVVVRGHSNECIRDGLLQPRARVIDCVINDEDGISDGELIIRIQEAIKRYSDRVNIFNLSINSIRPISSDEVGIVAYELDVLMLKYDIQFIISSGNHYLWESMTMEDALLDPRSRIAAPAESIMGVTVGAIVGEGDICGLTKKDNIAPYSRIGPGVSTILKPDIMAKAGGVSNGGGGFYVPRDDYSTILNNQGSFSAVCGTSYAAPKVAGDLAQIYSSHNLKDMLLAKALLFHGTDKLWDEADVEDDSEYSDLFNLFGRGLSNPENSIYSQKSKVTFVRVGELNRLLKQHVCFHMPSNLSSIQRRNVARVTVTCVSKPPIDRSKGSEYSSAYISASLHKNGSVLPSHPSLKEGRKKWDSCCHFSRTFSKFNAGDWQVWLELFSRWDVSDDYNVPYALAVSIEDLSGELDIYNQIIQETSNVYRPITEIRVETRVR